jgi:uncharacterized protein YjiS (DUF1127 family)
VRSGCQHASAPWLAATGGRSDGSASSALIARRGGPSPLVESLAILAGWRRRHRYRRELARLIRAGSHLIEDIGLVRAHAERAAAKPFWRA